MFDDERLINNPYRAQKSLRMMVKIPVVTQTPNEKRLRRVVLSIYVNDFKRKRAERREVILQ